MYLEIIYRKYANYLDYENNIRQFYRNGAQGRPLSAIPGLCGTGASLHNGRSRPSVLIAPAHPVLRDLCTSMYKTDTRIFSPHRQSLGLY
jgi:hypothetical protein